MSNTKLVLVFAPENCPDPYDPHAHNPFGGIEIYTKLPEYQVASFIDRKKLHNPTWQFLVVDDVPIGA